MRDKKMFVLKIVWRKSIASLHRLNQDVQRDNLRRTAGDPTWVLQVLLTANYSVAGMWISTQLNKMFLLKSSQKI